MGMKYAINEEYEYAHRWLSTKELEDKYDEILESNISILRTWISLSKIETTLSTKVDLSRIYPRINNHFYTKCMFHYPIDTPVCIDENRKAFFCYGCCTNGTIVGLIEKFFNISTDDSVEIIHAFINNNIDGLTKDNLEILKTAFKYYNSEEADKLLEESKRKTEVLDNRIKNYIEKNNSNSDDIKHISKRLCCSKQYVKKFIPEKIEQLKPVDSFIKPDDNSSGTEGLPFWI